MPPSMSPLAYVDIRGLLDKVLGSENGVRVTCDGPGQATQLVFRINACRKVDRQENKKIFADDPGHPMFGRSIYDSIAVSHKRGENEVYIRVLKEDTIKVEEL